MDRVGVEGWTGRREGGFLFLFKYGGGAPRLGGFLDNKLLPKKPGVELCDIAAHWLTFPSFFVY